MAESYTIVTCANYNTKYSPNVEARNPIDTYTCKCYSTTYSGERKILEKCELHSNSGSCTVTISAGLRITADKINKLIDEVRAELERRGLSKSSITKVTVGNLTYPNIISLINTAIERMAAISGKLTPYAGLIIAASLPTPAINTLKSLVKDCVCYTDCTNYGICVCYGYCNHY